MTPNQTAELFQNQILATAQNHLHQLTKEARTQPIAPGKWSPIQLLGHLVDSAANNHARFVKAQLTDALVFDGYVQEAWVTVQHYTTTDWEALVNLWYHYNQHIAHIIQHISEANWSKPRTTHNLDQIAWKTRTQEETVTLGYFILDYIGHLEHHIRQISSEYPLFLKENPL